MKYSPEAVRVALRAGTDHEVIIEGFSNIEEISINKERHWASLVRVEDDKTHVVEIWDNSHNFSFVNFTEAGYNKHIKDLKPSVKSPFCFTKQSVLLQGE